MKIGEFVKTGQGIVTMFIAVVTMIVTGVVFTFTYFTPQKAYAMDRSEVQEQIVETNEKMDCGFNEFLLAGIQRQLRELRFEYGRNLENADDDGWIQSEYDKLKTQEDKHEKIQVWCIDNGVDIKIK